MGQDQDFWMRQNDAYRSNELEVLCACVCVCFGGEGRRGGVYQVHDNLKRLNI